MFNIPNTITIFRIAVIPIMAFFMLKLPAQTADLDLQYSFWAFLIFTIAAASDLFDGYFARKLGQVSLIGKFFDPMADKLIHMTAMILLIPLGRISPTIVVILLFREIFVNGLRSMAAGEGMIISAGSLGKIKTAWLNAGIGFLILFHRFVFLDIPLRFDILGTTCLYIGLFFSVISGLQYSYSFFSKHNAKG